jgi:hypothetical protein
MALVVHCWICKRGEMQAMEDSAAYQCEYCGEVRSWTSATRGLTAKPSAFAKVVDLRSETRRQLEGAVSLPSDDAGALTLVK